MIANQPSGNSFSQTFSCCMIVSSFSFLYASLPFSLPSLQNDLYLSFKSPLHSPMLKTHLYLDVSYVPNQTHSVFFSLQICLSTSIFQIVDGQSDPTSQFAWNNHCLHLLSWHNYYQWPLYLQNCPSLDSISSYGHHNYLSEKVCP